VLLALPPADHLLIEPSQAVRSLPASRWVALPVGFGRSRRMKALIGSAGRAGFTDSLEGLVASRRHGSLSGCGGLGCSCGGLKATP
jgi:hypothetical protein